MEPIPVYKSRKRPNAVRDAYLHSSKQENDYEHTKEYYDTERNRTPINTFE